MITRETRISDVIVPELFAQYVLQKNTEKNAFISSGIATSDATIGESLRRGGKGIDLPFWKNLNGEAEVLEEDTAMTINKITAGGDYAAVHARGIGYGATDLSKLFSGSDPMGAIASKVNENWQKEMQKILLASLDGVFASAGMADHILDISGNEGNAGVLSNDALVDAIYLLGDESTQLTGIAMHSAVMAKLAKLKLLDDIPRDASSTAPEFRTYLGRRIIVDDAIAPVGGKYPIYLFGNGSVAYNENASLIEVETDRDKAKGADYLFTRRVFTMHPRGIKWIGKPAKETASNAELKVGTNWELVEESKNVHIAKLIVRLA